MSAMPTDPPPEATSIDTGSPVERITTTENEYRPVVRFQVDDDDTILIAREPKSYTMLQLIRAEVRGSVDSVDNWMAAALDGEVTVNTLTVREPDPADPDDKGEHLEEATYDYLRRRLNDPDDDFDLPQITAVKDRLQELWSGTPTGGPGGSSTGPRKSGKRSRGKRR